MHFPRAHEKSGMVAHAAQYCLIDGALAGVMSGN